MQYSIRVRGVLTDVFLGAFPQLQTTTVDGETVLVGDLPDQAALHGLLDVIESLGLELLELRQTGRRRPRGHF